MLVQISLITCIRILVQISTYSDTNKSVFVRILVQILFFQDLFNDIL